MAAAKKDEPKDVEAHSVEVIDNAYAVLEIDGTKYKLWPSQVHRLRRDFDQAYVELPTG